MEKDGDDLSLGNKMSLKLREDKLKESLAIEEKDFCALFYTHLEGCNGTRKALW